MSNDIKRLRELSGMVQESSYEERFSKFVQELEALSNKYQIGVSGAGVVFDVAGNDTPVRYQNDWSSGDIDIVNHED